MKPRVIERLVAAGLRPAEAEQKARLFELAFVILGLWGESSASGQMRLYVPGRIEALGKHTDYAGGGRLFFTVEPRVCGVAERRGGQFVRIAAHLFRPAITI